MKEWRSKMVKELNKTYSMKEILHNSEKWKKMVEDNRIKKKGVALKEDVKKKISEGLKKYYSENKPKSREIINK